MNRPNLMDIFLEKRFILLIIISVVSFFSASDVKADNPPDENYHVSKVVIDAGHGGKDPGALGARSQEKNIALSIALKLGNYITENFKDVEVIYTRKTDEFIELYRRGDIANEAHADLFISIHCNSCKNPKISGTETYVMGLHTNDRNMEVARKENSVISYEKDYSSHYEGFDPNSPESYIIFSLMQNTFLNQSLQFATMIQHQFRDRVKRNDRGVRQAGFAVLWRTTMPSVLIETGYISNQREEIFLNSPTGQEYIASAIFRAFRNYKEDIERKSHFTHTQVEPAASLSVQILSSKKQISPNSRSFKGYKNVREFHPGAWYKYTLGNFTSYDEVLAYSKKIQKDFKGAFIIGIKNEKIIPANEAISEINR